MVKAITHPLNPTIASPAPRKGGGFRGADKPTNYPMTSPQIHITDSAEMRELKREVRKLQLQIQLLEVLVEDEKLEGNRLRSLIRIVGGKPL